MAADGAGNEHRSYPFWAEETNRPAANIAECRSRKANRGIVKARPVCWRNTWAANCRRKHATRRTMGEQ